MTKLKNQILLIVATFVFIMFILFSQYIITHKIYKSNDFEDIESVVTDKEFILKNIYYDGKYLSNSINQNIDLNKLLTSEPNNKSENFISLKAFFRTSYTVSNITLFDKNIKEVTSYYKFNKQIDIDKKNIQKFIDSNNDEVLSSIYLKKIENKIQVPYVPKIAYLKKVYKNGKVNAILALEYDLNFRLKNFFNNSKYDFILLDGKGEALYHYDDLKSWSNFVKRDISFKDEFKNYYNSILTNESFKTEKFHAYRLNVKIDNGLILICSLKEEYLDSQNDLQFKRKISFFLTFIIATVIMLSIALIILEKSSKSLLKVKKLSNDLKNVQRFFSLAQQVAQIGLWKVDVYNNLIWNEWMFKILEIKNDKTKMTYDTFISYIHPDDKEKFDIEYRFSKNKLKESHLSYRVITTSGKVKWVEQRWKHYYNKDNNFIYTIGSLYDITDRKNIEDMFQRDNKDLKNRIDSLPIGVVLIDFDKNIKFVNKTFERILGVTQKEIFRKKVFDVFLDEDKELFNLLLVDIQEKKFLDNKEVRFIASNGDVITSTISLKLNTITKEILITLNDVTTKVKEHEKYLINQSRLANLGEMLIDLTYQWRQPLSLISTSASFLKLEHEIKAEQREETIDVLGKIIESSTRLSNTIDDFKYYVEDSTEESTFSVNNSIEKVLIILENQLYENDIEIVTDYDEDIDIKNVENSFMQVLVSVIKNSIEALQEYPKQKKLIIISTSILKDKLEINITDNAHGIGEKVMPMIFNEFFTTKTDRKSTGLGLYLAKKIVSSKLKGSIMAVNKDFKYKKTNYKGVCFTISISLLK